MKISITCLVALFLIFSGEHSARAQMADSPWAVGLQLGVTRPNDDFRNAYFKGRNFETIGFLSLNRYINAHSNLSFGTALGHLSDYNSRPEVERTVVNKLGIAYFMYDYKFLIKTKYRPYISIGVGLLYADNFLARNNIAFTLPASIGFRWVATERFSFDANIRQDATSTDRLDGWVAGKFFDNFLTYNIGVFFTFVQSKKTEKEVVVVSDKNVKPSPPLDTHVDSIDSKDSSPTVASPTVASLPPEVKKEDIKRLNTISRSVNFMSGETTLTSASFPVLDEVATLMNANPSYKLTIEGHTDNVGDPVNNFILSETRADAVKKYLLSKGVSSDRLTTKGFGDLEPIDDNKTEKGRANNRRSELKLH